MSAGASGPPAPHETLIAVDEAEQVALAADRLGRAIDEAVRTRGVARVALSGGTTPLGAYLALGRLALPWDAVEWFWVDERAGAPDGPRSNYAAAVRALGPTASARSHRMEADDPDLEAAATRYARALRRTFGVASAVAFDAITLGVGDDGHTASLFPRTGDVRIDDRLVAAIPARGALEPRVTLTAPVLREARLVLVLARGASKREPVARARAPGPPDEVPARLVLGARGRVVWLLDRAAAGEE